MLSAIITSDYLVAQSVQRGLDDSNSKCLIYKTDFSVTDHYDFVYHDGFLVLLKNPNEQHVNFCSHLQNLSPGKKLFVLIEDCEIEVLNMIKEAVNAPLFFAPFSYHQIASFLQRDILCGTDEPMLANIDDLNLKLDPRKRTLHINDEIIIQLINKEFYILQFLINNKGRVVSKTDMFEFIWGKNLLGSMATIDVHMSRLRRKIKKHVESPIIKTIPCAGYIIE
jgi:hypothetical protein